MIAVRDRAGVARAAAPAGLRAIPRGTIEQPDSAAANADSVETDHVQRAGPGEPEHGERHPAVPASFIDVRHAPTIGDARYRNISVV